ncbi:DUF2628 domain-containing protein [Thiorhodovibrio frisius]|uniref:DUF2628 domain-containing protein n=1 Tax=Thiorhodovibrio frisius TaxID=631362 RepID=H8YX72_9GAMM|nr:DUF2628 domain-containing protein [Thiorhodovibrio frisius]EIC23048.1 Protein of unknown function (DUF2628) [Thiorhodovibrio frisius]WPL22687.1 hypothetical protein Thiofri_02857 [Thiorhodovibrio frisius]
MKTFDVYKHPTRGHEAVKRGFCWPAFFFSWIWAFIKKLWGMGFAFIGIMLVLVTIETAFEQGGSDGGVGVMLLLELGVFFWFGSKGNDWRNNNLRKRGYDHVQTIEAETPDAAIASAAKSSVTIMRDG